MFQKFFATGMALVCFAGAYAQDSTVVAAEDPAPKPPMFSGSVDAYYRFNFANAKNVGVKGATNNYTSFTNSQNSFELGMASVKFEHSIGKVSVVADLGFGKRAQEFSYADEGEGSLLAVKQAYISYAPSEHVKFSAGSWGTHVGYELVDPQLNRNYSMSYMFSYGPFLHTGFKADFTFGKSGFMLGVANPTDFKSANFTQKMMLAQYSLAASDKVKIFINYVGGKTDNDNKLHQFDAVVTGTITDKFSIGYNGTVQTRKSRSAGSEYGDGAAWWGSALYLNVDPVPGFGLTLRGEYINDKKDILGFDGNIFATTLSANFRVGPLVIIPELRVDSGSKEIFVKDTGAGTKSTGTFLVAAVYKF
ncbi:MAG: outer membrane beta-barrel protein [Flavitalea sp.]